VGCPIRSLAVTDVGSQQEEQVARFSRAIAIQGDFLIFDQSVSDGGFLLSTATTF